MDDERRTRSRRRRRSREPEPSGNDDIVRGCEKSGKNRRRHRETGDHAGRHGGRQHDHDRRRARDPARPREADRIADPDGHRAARQTHRGALAAHQGLRAARLARRHRVRRLGHLRRQLVRGGQDRRRAREGAARADPSGARTDQAVVGGVRSPLRQAPRWPERQEGQEQEGAGGPAPRGHAALQAGAWPQPPRDGVVRQHRDLPDRIAGPRQRRGVREGAGSERSLDPLEHGLRVRGDQGRHPVHERCAEPERRRAGADPARRAERRRRSPART